MVVEISQMIDYLDAFVDGDVKETIVGGIAGTEINKFAVEAATKNHDFSKVLVIEGCQDYIGLLNKPITNVKHWADLFVEDIIDPLIPFDPWKPKCEQPLSVPRFANRIDTNLLSQYEMMVVYDMSLIPYAIRKAMSHSFPGQIIWVVDPLEPNALLAMEYSDRVPVVVDTLRKLSPILGMARKAVGIDTRAIETKVKGSVIETSKMNKRSIGKIDDKQYITNDVDLYETIIQKQYESPFRKNQKVLVDQTVVDMMNENGIRKASIGYNSLLIIENPNAEPLMKMRLYNSKITYYTNISYRRTPLGMSQLLRRDQILVKPGNIIYPGDAQYHRYNHSVVILTNPISPVEKYSILKNSNNVTIVNKYKT